MRAPRNWTKSTLAILVVILMVAGGSFVLAAHPSASAATSQTAAAPAATPPTHGDLVVTSGETYTIQPTGGVPQYYQGGNITVESGGTLIVRNVSLIFVQFVADTGTPIVRLSHIYSFSDAGTVEVLNSTITTDMNVLNAYAKLNVAVTGTWTAWHSTLAFPGWLTIAGSSATATFNDSVITGNPAVVGANEPALISADTEYAPSILVSGGAQLNLFATTVNETYADDTTSNGMPGPLPLNATDVVLGGAGENVTDLATPTDSISLTQDWLYYATGVSGGQVFAFYNNTGGVASSVDVEIWYEGIGYPVGTLALANDTTDGVANLTLPAGLIAAINAGGMLSYLNNTGDFGTPSGIALNFTAVTGPSVTLSTTGLELTPPLQYNVVATGSGTTVTTANSAIDLTFADLPASPLSQVSPFPWQSNKLLLGDGATAYLANLTVPSTVPGVFSTSAVLTDATSSAYLYRWANFNITSIDNHVNVSGASVAAFYAYDTNQANNATVTALNDLASTSPAMWQYLQFWDGTHGISRYGSSNVGGQAYLMLASTVINATDLPSGTFLGGYHVGFRTPYVNNTTWISYSVSPYPTGVALGSIGYGQPDRANVQVPVAPPVVEILTLVGPTSPLNPNDQYSSSGTIFLNGPGEASITLYASPVGGGSQITIAGAQVDNGSFSFDWEQPLPLSAGTSYDIEAIASYKGVSASHDLGIFSIPSTTSPVGFLFQKFLGLPLWIWIAIAVAVVVAILVVLLVFRRQAAGKLVECGECGELIPEDATVCPKCGAEFESDMVRCSRCSATIPAKSQFCPECSAQLLGAPGEGASDPERQAYADFTEKFRTEGKRELGDNYTESAFWDWWKRQPTYVPFSQWSAQQNKGTPRAGMSAPPVGSESVASATPPPAPRGAAPAPAGSQAGMAAPPAAAAPAAGAAGLKPCPNCGKEIPPEYLVCPFCGAVTQ